MISPAELTTILGRKDFGKPRSEKGPGPGESICRFPGRIYVLTGQTMITVSFSNAKEGEDTRKELIALARAVMAKLKG